MFQIQNVDTVGAFERLFVTNINLCLNASIQIETKGKERKGKAIENTSTTTRKFRTTDCLISHQDEGRKDDDR